MEKIKKKNERGATGLDVATGVLIFVMFTTVILTLYVQIYKYSSLIKIHEDAMGYIIQMCEDIDMKEYGEIEDLTEYREELIQKTNLDQNRYKLLITQEKYIDENPEAEDIVKRLKISIIYNFDNQDREITINKIKVKE